jgi:hypothetical protein
MTRISFKLEDIQYESEISNKNCRIIAGHSCALMYILVQIKQLGALLDLKLLFKFQQDRVISKTPCRVHNAGVGGSSPPVATIHKTPAPLIGRRGFFIQLSPFSYCTLLSNE